MKIEQIIEQWTADSKIDNTELDLESLKIPSLHSKYLRILSEERSRLKALKIQQKELYRDLADYYRGDLNDPEELERLGKEPWPRTVMKTEIGSFVDADETMIKLTTRIMIQEEAVEVAAEILKSINGRGFLLNTAVNYRKMTQFGQ